MAPALEKGSMTKKEVMACLGKSKRTVEILIREGRLPVSYINGPSGKTGVFQREHVERLKQEMETPTARAVLADTDHFGSIDKMVSVEPAAQALATVFSDALAASMRPQLEVLQAVLRSVTPVAPAPPDRPWLTLNEATKYSGLTKAYLRRAAKAGAAFALNIGAPGKCDNWRFNREALGKGLAIQVGKGTRA
jgi:hypothetical protein